VEAQSRHYAERFLAKLALKWFLFPKVSDKMQKEIFDLILVEWQ
jgi:hypothetical protein